MEEKAKLAELIAEALFLQQRQLAENKAEQLRVQEKLAKAKARSQIYKEMEERMSLNPKKKDHGPGVSLFHYTTIWTFGVSLFHFSV